MKVYARKYEFQLWRRYSRIKNGRRRRAKLAAVDAKVQEKLSARFSAPPAPAEVEREEERDEQAAMVRVLQSGFHPDLVFVAPGVGGDRRREAIRRVCGMNLESDADFWLLENLWKAMRGDPPPVPLVVGDAGYRAHAAAGFLEVPWDFTVPGLCDLLEEHLDDVRAGLRRRRAGAGDGPGPPPPPAEPLAEPPRLGAAGAEGWDDERLADDDAGASSTEEDSDSTDSSELAQRRGPSPDVAGVFQIIQMHDVQVKSVCTEWFVTWFAKALPSHTVLRVG
ncbi:unnamed protein product, partial [Prorocentrum cordatum]